MAKTRVVKNFRPVQSLYGNGPVPVYTWPEGASQTFAVGDPLMITGGYAVVHGGGTNDRILGFAAKAGANTTAGAATTSFWPALPGIVFEGSLVATATTSHTLLITNFGVAYGLVLYTADTPNVWAIDVSEVTDCLFKVCGLGSGDDGDASCALADVNARVKVMIPAECCQIMSYATVP